MALGRREHADELRRDVKFFIEVFVTLFVIMDPPGTIPVFLALTSGRSHAMRKRPAWPGGASSRSS